MAKLSDNPTVGNAASLPEVHGSVRVAKGPQWRRFLAFAGPAYLVSVGYMDPGNWATDLAGGSAFGYKLLWVILASSLMAMVLQTLCARLGVASGRDLAQVCKESFPKPVGIVLWLLAEVAIVCTDIAEVIGSAIALNLLFGIPLVAGVVLTGLDVLLLLGLMRFEFKKIEAIIMVMVATIFGCFCVNLALAKPDWAAVLGGMVTPTIPSDYALFVAVGIIGATVMPHNLYLHSALVQTRGYGPEESDKREAIKHSTIDTLIALGGAFFVNAAILVLAAAVFHGTIGVVDDLSKAHELLKPALGGVAATLFAVALLASGQSSTITATLAGQVVMEGFTNWHVKPWIRRMVTRGLAIIPAVIIVGGSGASKTVELLTVTQVILTLQLPFAVFPLVMVTSDRMRMGVFTNPVWVRALAYSIGTVITVLNLKLLSDKYIQEAAPRMGYAPLVLAYTALIGFAAWMWLGYRSPKTTS
jgi:manganese transport protein